MKKGVATLTVSKGHLAPLMKTGTCYVLSTAVLSSLIEEASINAIPERNYQPGQTTVAAYINIKHRKPSILGANLKATADIRAIDNKKVEFFVEVFDETGLIGSGEHVRCFVNSTNFEKQCYSNHRKEDLL